MKLTISVKDLLHALNAVGKVIQKKNTLAILDNVMFNAQDGSYTITGSSVENSLTMPIALTINAGDEFKPFCINPTSLVPLLSTLAEQPVTLDLDFSTHNAKLTYNSGVASMPFQETEDYPKMATLGETTVEFSIPTSVLLPATKAAAAFTGKDQLRPILSSVALDADSEGVTFAGTDGHWLYKYIYHHGAPFLTKGGKDMLLLPAEVVSALSVFAGNEMVTVAHDGKHISIMSEGITFVVRDMEGRYPNYNGVIPKDSPYHVVMPVKAMSDALKRVQLMAPDTSRLVKFSKEPMFLALAASDLDFARSAREQLSAADCDNACTWPDGQYIGFNASHLLSVLQYISTENVRFELAGQDRAALLKEDDGQSSLTILLMPVLVND